ncbi:hypothetical protein [Saccharopolyspora tripterygii]
MTSGPGLRSRERTWTWDDVVRKSATRAALLREMRDERRPFHLGVLLWMCARHRISAGSGRSSAST